MGSWRRGVGDTSPAEPRRAADCLQRPLRSRFRQQLTPSVRSCGREGTPQDRETSPPHHRDRRPARRVAPATDDDRRPRQAKTQDQDTKPRHKAKTQGQDRPRQTKTDQDRRRRRQTPARDGLDRFGEPAHPTCCLTSGILSHRTRGGRGPGRGSVRDLTWRSRRRATAGILRQASVCWVWPAPQLRR